MVCTYNDLRRKGVVCVSDGAFLGSVYNAEIEVEGAKITRLFIREKFCWNSFWHRGDEIIICWDDIQLIGEDTILIKKVPEKNPKKSSKIIEALFG